MTSNPSQALAATSAEPDPELLALPAPPKQGRALTMVVMAVTTIAAVVLAWSLRSEALYSASPGAPIELGELEKKTPSPEVANRYVRGSALLGTTGAIRYGRAAESDTYRLAPVAGNDKIWVEIRVPEGFEGPRFIPPTTFAGRLVPMSESGLRHEGLKHSVRERGGGNVPPDAWVLVDGSSPRASRWALGMLVILIGFIGWNLFSIFRLAKRVRDSGDKDGDRRRLDTDDDDELQASRE